MGHIHNGGADFCMLSHSL